MSEEVGRKLWLEDSLTPRVDRTTRRTWWWTGAIQVEHPGYFRAGDLCRFEPYREAFFVRSVDRTTGVAALACLRSIGRVRRLRFLRPGALVYIIGGGMSEDEALRTKRSWRFKKQRPFRG